MQLYLDTVVTLFRFKKVGMDFVNRDQAILISLYKKGAIPVSTAKEIKEWLNEQEEEKRQELFDAFVLDKMKYPTERKKGESPKDSLDKMLVSLIDVCKAGDFEDEDWIEEQRMLIDTKWIEEVQDLLDRLKAKLDMNGTDVDASAKTITANA